MVFLADKKKGLPYIGIGTVVTRTWVNGMEKRIELQNVLHAPDIGSRFILIFKLGEKGISVTFEGSKLVLSRDGYNTQKVSLPGGITDSH